MLKKNEFMVLDEATSAIDPMQEHMLYTSFMDMTEGKTAFIITHRLGLAKLCDRIIVMRDGRILDQGNHEELLQSSEFYKSLWEIQAGSFV